MARNPDTDVRWRPGRGIVVALLALVAALATLTVIDQKLEGRSARTLRALRVEQRSSAARIGRLTKRLDAGLARQRVIDKRTRAIEQRLGPVLREYRAADKQRTSLTSNVSAMRSQLDDWVEVPDIGLENETIAQSDVESAGLTWTAETIEGTCADYQDHFVDRGYGWSDVVKQDPAPGSRMPSGGSVTINTWDYASNWELPCTLGDETGDF